MQRCRSDVEPNGVADLVARRLVGCRECLLAARSQLDDPTATGRKDAGDDGLVGEVAERYRVGRAGDLNGFGPEPERADIGIRAQPGREKGDRVPPDDVVRGSADLENV